MSNKLAILYTTINTSQEAEILADLAITSKLSVCVNIIAGGKSIYLWNGRIEQSEEYYMVFKTTIDLIEELKDIITQNHPYDVPVILKWECEANNDFSEYVKKELV